MYWNLTIEDGKIRIHNKNSLVKCKDIFSVEGANLISAVKMKDSYLVLIQPWDSHYIKILYNTKQISSLHVAFIRYHLECNLHDYYIDCVGQYSYDIHELYLNTENIIGDLKITFR